MADDDQSLVEAIYNKFQSHQGEHVQIFVPKTMPGINESGEMVVSKHLTLDCCNITCCGDVTELSNICKDVTELDISGNKITEWTEVYQMVQSMKQLSFLNISGNPLNSSNSLPSADDVDVFTKLCRLILNRVELSWLIVEKLISQMPNLLELHLSLNKYTTVNELTQTFSNIQILYFNGNHISSWTHICLLGKIFPNLHSLVIMEMPFAEIDVEEEQLSSCFPYLESLNISKCKIQQWRHIEKINSLPNLVDIKLKGMPLFRRYNDDDLYRQLCIGFLPAITHLNCSFIGFEERENAERAFIRYFKPKSKQPDRLQVFIDKHGNLDQLAQVDMTPESSVTIEIKYRDSKWNGPIALQQSVGEFRQFINRTLQIPTEMKYRLFYHDLQIEHGPDLLKVNSKMLYTLNLTNGDVFYVD